MPEAPYFVCGPALDLRARKETPRISIPLFALLLCNGGFPVVAVTTKESIPWR